MKLRNKLVCLILIIGICLCGCDKGENKSIETNANSDRLMANQVKLKDKIAEIDSEMDKESFGEVLDYSESKSCLYDGYDKTYKFQDVIVVTYPLDGKEYISSITMLNNNTINSWGIKIGDNTEKIKESFKGLDLVTSDTCYSFKKDKSGVAFYLNEEVITEIEIYSVTE